MLLDPCDAARCDRGCRGTATTEPDWQRTRAAECHPDPARGASGRGPGLDRVARGGLRWSRGREEGHNPGITNRIRGKRARRRAMEAPVTETLNPVKAYQQFIGGQWVDAASGETLDVENPATGEVVATVPASGQDGRRPRGRRRGRRLRDAGR